MRSEEFWRYFETIRPQLGARAQSFTAMFEHLDRCDRPVGIVETGCTRDAGNWTGDGNSTVLFDRYAEFHPGSVVYSVDIDPKATALCKSIVSERVRVHTSDSVAFLKQLADVPPGDLAAIDLLYLDSYDVNFDDPLPSALHHLKELVAIAPQIRPETLVVVDDSPTSYIGFADDKGAIQLMLPPKVGGKGKLVAEYARHVGAENVFAGYQAGWLRMRAGAGGAVPTSSFVSAIITTSPQGSFAVGADDNAIGARLRQEGNAGLEEVERAASYVTSRDEVLVVGTHVGTVAIPLAKHCRHVTGVEANPSTYKMLQCNLILNDVDNFSAFNFAASDKPGSLQFVLNTQNSGGSKRMPVVRKAEYFHDDPEVIEVPAFSLDDKLGGGNYALVLMDIEGSEYFALRGMQRILAQARTLIVEFIPHHLSDVAGITPEEFVVPVLPHFKCLWIPSANKTVDRADFAKALRYQFDRKLEDAGIVFTK